VESAVKPGHTTILVTSPDVGGATPAIACVINETPEKTALIKKIAQLNGQH
jgi:hypothetical protein